MSDYSTRDGANTIPVLAIIDRATARELTVAQIGALAAGTGMSLAEFLGRVLDLLL